MADDRVVVGFIVRAHGIRGAVLVKPITDDPGTRFTAGAVFHAESGLRLDLTAVTPHPGGLVMQFDQVADRETAETLAGSTVTIDRADRRPLTDGEYWPEDLVGCTMVSPNGTTIGTVVGYEFGAAQDRLVVATPDGASAEVPFVDALVPEVDVERRVVVADLPAGLVDPES